jgi:hypothetical protein
VSASGAVICPPETAATVPRAASTVKGFCQLTWQNQTPDPKANRAGSRARGARAELARPARAKTAYSATLQAAGGNPP